MRRAFSLALAVFAAGILTAGRAEALSVRDVIELSKAGLGEEVLLALIEVDPVRMTKPPNRMTNARAGVAAFGRAV